MGPSPCAGESWAAPGRRACSVQACSRFDETEPSRLAQNARSPAMASAESPAREPAICATGVHRPPVAERAFADTAWLQVERRVDMTLQPSTSDLASSTLSKSGLRG